MPSCKDGTLCGGCRLSPTFYSNKNIDLAVSEPTTRMWLVYLTVFVLREREGSLSTFVRGYPFSTHRNVYPGVSLDCPLEELVRQSFEVPLGCSLYPVTRLSVGGTVRARPGTPCRFTGCYAYRRKGTRRVKACPRPRAWSVRMFFANDPPTVTSILPVACSGVDQLACSFPAEFPFSVNLDEVI